LPPPALSSAQPEYCDTHVGRALTLSFVHAAAALSVLGIVTFWCLGDVGAERERDCNASEDDARLVVSGGESRTLGSRTCCIG
jgi:hypothetical protein